MILQRDEEGPDAPTFGTLRRDDSTLVCQVLELPDRGNQHNISRIPAGTYTANRFDSPHIGYVLFQLADVPQRNGIDMHIGSTMKDTDGCILLGETRGTVYDKNGENPEPGLLHSGIAFAAFMALMSGVDSFSLEVNDPIAVVV